MRLNIGCGGSPLPDYINVDMDTIDDLRRRYPNKTFSDDLVIKNWDVLNLPLEANSVDEIRTDSFIEHLRFVDEPKFFEGVKRVLKPGGTFNFSAPDFEEVCRMWLAAKDDWKEFYRDDAEAIATEHWFGNYSSTLDNRWGYLTTSIFGNQNGEGQFHTNAYTEEKIRAICKLLDFKIEEFERYKWKGDRDPMLRFVVSKR